MPSIANVSLKIDRATQGNRHKVTVSYQLRFTPREELAGTVFEERVQLRGDDPVFDEDRGAPLLTSFVKATPANVNRTISKMVSSSVLDEDGDTIIFGVPILALRDELYARVTLRPFQPGSASSDSNVVKGQFGPAA
ncbi:hypothetical protein [Aquabacterium sp.]|uniref:hypothetical protein n=1 Tax=Aquabacterium sp. TaxID=1872578 RepID=UPI003783D9F1